MIILYDNKVYDATITPNSEQTGYEFSTALKNTRLSRTGRFVGDASENIVFDFGSALSCDYCVVAGSNLTSGATVTIQANASNAWTSNQPLHLHHRP